MKTSLNMLLLGALMLAGGCSHDYHNSEQSRRSPFIPEGQPRRVAMMADAQASVGARDDGMLHAWDFDGKDLSPLGREKLSSMIEADSLEPISIYLDVKSDTFKDRKQSVIAFLQDKGVADAHLNVVEGVNDSTLHPAAADMAMYAKTDTSAEASAGSSANSNTASAK